MRKNGLLLASVLLTFFLVFQACKTDDVTAVDATPTISAFSPTSGAIGTSITITGTNFSATAASNIVKFNGTTAPVSAATTTTLTVAIPTSATTGTITVTVGSLTATSSASFTVTAAVSTAPTIASFTPITGAIGASVTITGTNFSTTIANNTVKFNGTTAIVSAATATSITTTVPTGATTGKITVTVGTNTATSTSDFTVGTTTSASGSAAKVFAAVEAFKATLTAAQITTATLAYTKANAIKWSNLPGGVSIRNGLEFSTLSATQLAAANAVIAAAAGTTANEGYAEFTQVRLADTFLGLKAGSGYSEGKYIIAFVGTPSATGTWMLQFGGHHYAQNITYSNGAVVSTTPSHQGVEPLSFLSGTTTYEPLKNDHAGMLAMLQSLTAAQLTTAKLSATFSDVLLGPNKDGQFPATKLGIKVSALTTAQKALVLAAMKSWTADVDDVTGTSMLAIYEKELDETYISYSGNATLAANADYVRIDGPSVWIELVCQSGVVYTGVHYHAVYRDHTRDYNGL